VVEWEDVARVQEDAVELRPEARLHWEAEDDGSALPPRRHSGLDAEPVNTGE
jgi:hypothetical protein